jgi:electron transfer flavoprotein alpha/beta subunit
MKIIVPIKQVPEIAEVKIDPETKTLIRAGVPSMKEKSSSSPWVLLKPKRL